MKKLLSTPAKSILILMSITLSSLLYTQCGQKEPLPPAQELICEYQQNPVGIDKAAPQLSWKIPPYRNGISQLAYEIVVASSQENIEKNVGDMWESGKVMSDQSVYVSYQGKPLESRKSYFWKVKYWDDEGGESTYSEAASWEMALLKKSANLRSF